MVLKILGVALVITGCGSVGFRIANNHRQEEKALRGFVGIIDYMECELSYRLTPLPELCRRVSQEFRNIPGAVFHELSKEMDAQVSPDIQQCMAVSLTRVRDVPNLTRNALQLLGKSIGHFDLNGQLKGLDAVRQECRRLLTDLEKDRDIRIRNYQTLGLCAGAALAILFV